VHVGSLLRHIHDTEIDLADEYRKTGERHAAEHDVFHTPHTLAKQCIAHANLIAPFLHRYAGGGKATEKQPEEPAPTESLVALLRRKLSEAGGRSRSSGLLLLRDLTNIYVAVSECEILWIQASQAAKALRDSSLLDVVASCTDQTATQLRGLRTRIKEPAPPTLTAG
jgi:hypothetical protein